MKNLAVILLLPLTLLAQTDAPTNWNYAAEIVDANMRPALQAKALATARANVIAASTGVTPMIDLAWNLPTNAYPNGVMPTNYAVVIVSSPDLTVPRSQWSVEFTGVLCTNCELPMTTSPKFYSAKAVLL